MWNGAGWLQRPSWTSEVAAAEHSRPQEVMETVKGETTDELMLSTSRVLKGQVFNNHEIYRLITWWNNTCYKMHTKVFWFASYNWALDTAVKAWILTCRSRDSVTLLMSIARGLYPCAASIDTWTICSKTEKHLLKPAERVFRNTVRASIFSVVKTTV